MLALVLAARPGHAEMPAGGLLGWVEDAHGAPLSGAVISLFGKGVGGAGLVTLSDSAGRFFVPSLPAGPYTLRALRDGHAPAAARKVLILPNQDATYTISLTAVDSTPRDPHTASSKDTDDSAIRDLQWLIRHKRRSVLEDQSAEGPQKTDATVVPAPTGLLASILPDLAGTLQVLTGPIGADVADAAEPTSWSLVNLNGRIADSGHWSLGGLVAERETMTWRMAGEFVFEPGGGHEIKVGTGYGMRALRPLAVGETQAQLDHGVGALSFQDRWQATDRITTTFGGRYSYAGFLENSNQLDRMFAIDYRRDEKSRLVGSARSRTLVPGGDVLTVSTVSSAPAVAYAMLASGLQPERVLRYEGGLDQDLGAFTVEAHAFYETIHDQLVNGFSESATLPHAITVSNGGWTGTRGMGLKVSRRFSEAVQGSMTYTYGHSWRPEGVSASPMLAFREGDFQDLAARFETTIEGTDTRLVAFCRVNRVASADLRPGSQVSARYDVQVSQGLPFLGALTRADWDVLVTVRNLFYEPTEGGVLDEMTVAHPPKRVLGGISVRF
jgi:hypothetical protein